MVAGARQVNLSEVRRMHTVYLFTLICIASSVASSNHSKFETQACSGTSIAAETEACDATKICDPKDVKKITITGSNGAEVQVLQGLMCDTTCKRSYSKTGGTTCKYDAECLTGWCLNLKCTAKADMKEPKAAGDMCRWRCWGTDLYCGSDNKCHAFAVADEDCNKETWQTGTVFADQQEINKGSVWAKGCKPGLYCDTLGAAQDKCKAFLDVGGACEDSIETKRCKSSLYCNTNNECEAWVDVDGECTTTAKDKQCKAGLYCIDDNGLKCKAPITRAAGENCVSTPVGYWVCAAGSHYCDTTCKALPVKTEACGATASTSCSTTVSPKIYCVIGGTAVCEEYVAADGDCSGTGKQCVAGHYCQSSGADQNKCKPYVALDGTCESDSGTGPLVCVSPNKCDSNKKCVACNTKEGENCATDNAVTTCACGGTTNLYCRGGKWTKPMSIAAGASTSDVGGVPGCETDALYNSASKTCVAFPAIDCSGNANLCRTITYNPFTGVKPWLVDNKVGDNNAVCCSNECNFAQDQGKCTAANVLEINKRKCEAGANDGLSKIIDAGYSDWVTDYQGLMLWAIYTTEVSLTCAGGVTAADITVTAPTKVTKGPNTTPPTPSPPTPPTTTPGTPNTPDSPNGNNGGAGATFAITSGAWILPKPADCPATVPTLGAADAVCSNTDGPFCDAKFSKGEVTGDYGLKYTFVQYSSCINKKCINTGSVAAGGVCGADADCASAWCKNKVCATVRTPPDSAGAACVATVPVAETGYTFKGCARNNMECVSSKCETFTYAVEGGACTLTGTGKDACDPDADLYCDGAVCKKFLAAGATCDGTALKLRCGEDLLCVKGNTCKKPLAVDGTCDGIYSAGLAQTAENPCELGLLCTSTKCVEVAATPTAPSPPAAPSTCTQKEGTSCSVSGNALCDCDDVAIICNDGKWIKPFSVAAEAKATNARACAPNLWWDQANTLCKETLTCAKNADCQGGAGGVSYCDCTGETKTCKWINTDLSPTCTASGYQGELAKRCKRIREATTTGLGDSIGNLLGGLLDALGSALGVATGTNEDRWDAFKKARTAMAQNNAAAFAGQIWCIKPLDIQPTEGGGGDSDGAFVTVPTFGVMFLALFALIAHLF